jgi:DNA-binding response OmpR family regulator
MGTTVAKRILVADDEEVTAQMWQDGLELEGYDVRKATQSLRFYDAVLSYQPDLIVLDLLMPYLGGKDELMLLQMHPTARRIPVIVVTAFPDLVGDPNELKKLGVVEIFTKPVSIDVLETAVKRALA